MQMFLNKEMTHFVGANNYSPIDRTPSNRHAHDVLVGGHQPVAHLYHLLE
jgi:hypothetical protein